MGSNIVAAATLLVICIACGVIRLYLRKRLDDYGGFIGIAKAKDLKQSNIVTML